MSRETEGMTIEEITITSRKEAVEKDNTHTQLKLPALHKGRLFFDIFTCKLNDTTGISQLKPNDDEHIPFK